MGPGRPDELGPPPLETPLQGTTVTYRKKETADPPESTDFGRPVLLLGSGAEGGLREPACFNEDYAVFRLPGQLSGPPSFFIGVRGQFFLRYVIVLEILRILPLPPPPHLCKFKVQPTLVRLQLRLSQVAVPLIGLPMAARQSLGGIYAWTQHILQRRA